MSDNIRIEESRRPGLDPRWPNRNIRVLFVDSEKKFVNAVSDRLEKHGFFVSTACSGKNSIRLLKKESYDVAVLDLETKHLHGLHIIKKLHRIYPDLPVIVLSGHGSDKKAKKCMACGAFDFLSKSCEFENLLNKIIYAYHSEMEPVD